MTVLMPLVHQLETVNNHTENWKCSHKNKEVLPYEILTSNSLIYFRDLRSLKIEVTLNMYMLLIYLWHCDIYIYICIRTV